MHLVALTAELLALLELITGKGPSQRHEIFYFAESTLGAVRIDEPDYRHGEPERRSYSFRKAATRSVKRSGCSSSGWCPASSMISKRAPGISPA